MLLSESAASSVLVLAELFFFLFYVLTAAKIYENLDVRYRACSPFTAHRRKRRRKSLIQGYF